MGAKHPHFLSQFLSKSTTIGWIAVHPYFSGVFWVAAFCVAKDKPPQFANMCFHGFLEILKMGRWSCPNIKKL